MQIYNINPFGTVIVLYFIFVPFLHTFVCFIRSLYITIINCDFYPEPAAVVQSSFYVNTVHVQCTLHAGNLLHRVTNRVRQFIHRPKKMFFKNRLNQCCFPLKINKQKNKKIRQRSILVQ